MESKSFIVPNYNAVVHLREVQGADSLHTKRYHEILSNVREGDGSLAHRRLHRSQYASRAGPSHTGSSI